MIHTIRANSIIKASNAINKLSCSQKSFINFNASKPQILPIINPGHSGTRLSIDVINSDVLPSNTQSPVISVSNDSVYTSSKIAFDNLMKKIKETYPKIIKDLHTEFSTDPKVIKLEQELRKIGTLFTSENDYNTTLAILKIFKKVKSMGLETPHKLLLATFKPDNLFAYTSGMEKGYERYSTLFIRRNLAEEVKLNNLKNKTNISIEHILLHELGHYNFLIKSPDNKEMFKIYDKFVHTYSHHYIDKHVSFNAITEPNGHEFIAEVFAGLIQGKKFPQPIIDCYNALGGMKIK